MNEAEKTALDKELLAVEDFSTLLARGIPDAERLRQIAPDRFEELRFALRVRYSTPRPRS